MSNRDLTLSMKMYADASRWVSGLANGESGTRKFTTSVRREFDALKNTLGSVEGRLASIGVTVGATASIIQSARLDKSLTQIGQTAGEGGQEVASLRKELFRMSKETGQPVDDLRDGFNNAVQAGLKFNEALPVIDATNKAMAVTSAGADVLTSSLTVASTAYNFDLKKPGLALNLLDKMTVAGRQGNAELENLSSIFGRIGPNAASAGMGFEQTLAFIEGLSQIERQPERLATLADSTLRLFTNLKYMKDAQKATGIKFFNTDGTRRDALDTIADIKKQYDKLNTDKERALYIQKAFGNADLDTIKGMRVLVSGDMLDNIRKFSGEISKANGTLERDLSKGIDNAVDQTGRLKGALREAADNFAQPINKTIANIIKYTMADKKDGGLGMDGKDMLLAGGGLTLGTLLAARYGGKAISGLAGMGAGVATGKALETAAGVTPVFVVNMPGGGISGMPGLPSKLPTAATAAGVAGAGAFAAKNIGTTLALLGGSKLSALRMMGAGAMGTAGAVGAASLGGGFMLGNTDIGGKIALHIMKLFGSKDAAMALDTMNSETKLTGTLNIKLDQDGRVIGSSVKTNQPGFNVNMANGPYMALTQ